MADVTGSILRCIRTSLGLGEDNTDFDTELCMGINSAISKLNQVGVGRHVMVTNEDKVWGDLMDSTQNANTSYFQMIPMYITLDVKMWFDPPPPSSLTHYQESSRELLWRLQQAYEGTV